MVTITITALDLSLGDEGLDLLKIQCQEKMSDKRHQMRVVAYGSTITENSLEGYPNIVVRPRTIAPVDGAFVKNVATLGTLVGGPIDPVNALIIAINAIMQSEMKGGVFKIVFLTSGNGHISIKKEELDEIQSMLQTHSILVNVVQVKQAQRDATEGSFWTWLGENSSGLVQVSTAETFRQPLQRFNVVKQMTKAKMDLEIGPVKIPVSLFIKTRKETLPSLKRTPGAGGAVKMDRSYHREDDIDGEEVLPADIVKAHRYGKEFVPIGEDDEVTLKYRCERCLKVLASLPQKEIPHYWLLGQSEVVTIQPGFGTELWISLLRALSARQSVLLARYSFRKDSTPRLVALFPSVDCLTLCYLPFSEDLRDWPFRDLAPPTPEQEAVTDKLVERMTLADSELIPEATFNPTFIRFQKLRIERLIDPTTKLGEPLTFDRAVPDDLKRQLASMFPVQKVEKVNLRKRYWIQAEDSKKKLEAVDVKKIRVSTDGGSASDALTHPLVKKEIGSMNPARDFAAHLKIHRVDVVDLIRQMIEHIKKFVEEGPDFFPKSRTTLEALRKGCIGENYPDTFNNFMRAEVDTGKAWWLEIKKEILLISDAECNTSSTSEEEARQFASGSVPSGGVQPVPVPIIGLDDDEDQFD